MLNQLLSFQANPIVNLSSLSQFSFKLGKVPQQTDEQIRKAISEFVIEYENLLKSLLSSTFLCVLRTENDLDEEVKKFGTLENLKKVKEKELQEMFHERDVSVIDIFSGSTTIVYTAPGRAFKANPAVLHLLGLFPKAHLAHEFWKNTNLNEKRKLLMAASAPQLQLKQPLEGNLEKVRHSTFSSH